jgi:antirestriction protein ArdC
LPPLERNAAAERFIANTKIPIIHDGDQAFYHPATDTVTMPRPELFCGTDTLSREEGYYAVLAHECAHATGHHSRCDRDLSSRFGTAGYAKEELIAEISSAIICAELGITQDTRPDHAAYIANWLQILKDDDKAIFHAAARASEAVNWLNARQPQPLTDHRPKAEEGTHLQNPALEQAGANDPGPTLSDERIFA